jgi:predicted HicB family RNase H-like nuclease
MKDIIKFKDHLGSVRFSAEYKGSFNVRIDPALHKKAVIPSSMSGLSLNQLVEEAIQEYITTKMPDES